MFLYKSILIAILSRSILYFIIHLATAECDTALYDVQNECATASHYHTLLWLKNVIKNVRKHTLKCKNVSKRI